MSVFVPPHSERQSPSPWTPVRAAIGTLLAAVVVFGLAFQFVSTVVFIAAGALAVGAGAGVLGALRALRSSLSRDAVPPPLAAFASILLIVGVTWGGLGTLRFVTLPGTPPRIANVPNPFVSPSAATAVTPAPTVAPTPTAATSPPASASPGASSSPGTAVLTPVKLPYTADWSKGLAGWAVSPNWTIVDGVLTNDGTSDDARISATAPIDLSSVRDYVVEADIELVRYGGGGYQSFGFVVRSVDDKTGYRIGHCTYGGYGTCNGDSQNYAAGIWNAGSGSALVSAQFKPPTQEFHHFKVEVKAATLTFTAPDVGVNLTTTDNAYLSGAQVGLWSQNCQISVRNFTVSGAP